jgi:hypothetical protein
VKLPGTGPYLKALFTCFIALTIAGTAWSADTDPLWERYIEAKIGFQNELAQFFLDSNSEFQELILTSRDLQVTLAGMRRVEYDYLLEHDPGRIIRDRGTARWSNFQWSAEDRENLKKVSPAYAALVAEKAVLAEKNRFKIGLPYPIKGCHHDRKHVEKQIGEPPVQAPPFFVRIFAGGPDHDRFDGYRFSDRKPAKQTGLL